MSSSSGATPSAGTFITRWSNLTPLGVVVTRCEVALAAMFLYAAYQKLFNGDNAPKLFSSSVQAFKLGLGDLATRLSTSVTPWVEVISSVLLLLGVWSRAAAAVLSLLLIFFILLIVQALVRGLDVSCGCFGELSPFCPEKVGVCNIIQNSIMLAVAGIVVLTPRSMLARTARVA